MNHRPDDWKYHELNLSYKTVVISGGTTGIGRATALLFASEGARVMIFGRREPQLNDALRDCEAVGEVIGMLADQAKEEDINKVFMEVDRRWGTIDVLVNNAAISGESVADQPMKDMRYVLMSNLFGYMACARAAVLRMQQSRKGHIVNVGSLSAEAHDPGGGIYVATKGAIRAWSRSLAKSVLNDGIKVTLIEPGNVGTDFRGHESREYQQMQEKNMLMLTAEDIAESIRYCVVQPTRCDITWMQIRPHRQMV